MNGVWRCCLAFTLGVSAAPMYAADSDRVCARSAPAPTQAAQLGRPVPPSVTLDRPRVIATTGTISTLKQVNYSETAPPVFRAQNSDGFQPMPTGKGASPVSVPVPAQSTFPPPTLVEAPNPAPTPSWEGYEVGGCCAGSESDRFGFGDGCTHNFNNCFYLKAEYLLWWLRGSQVPPLVVADNNPLGTFNPLTTQTLFGGSSLGREEHGGGRFRGGYWFDSDHCVGIEGSFFFLGERGNTFNAASTGFLPLGIPVHNMGMPAVFPIAQGTTPGSISAAVETRLWGVEGNFRTNWHAGERWVVDIVGGYRGLGLDDNVELNAATTTDGAMTQFSDRFSTRNRFYGGQLGAVAEWKCGRWSLDFTGKVALGCSHQQVEIGGSTSINMMPALPGGILAQPTNMVDVNRNRFAVVPEVGINLNFQLTDFLRLSAGYNFLYWSSVARAGEQIDTEVGQAGRPAFGFRGTDFWAHGVNVGLEFRY